MEDQITFKQLGRRGYMGFAWFHAYDTNGQPIMKRGVHLGYNATDAHHAMEMHKQMTALLQK